MADEWYYARGKEKVGPVTTAQLKKLARSGELSRNDMVWKEGMAKWKPAAEIKGLFDTAPSQPMRASVPPPLPHEEEAVADVGPELALPWPAHERNGFSVGQWVGLGASGFFGLVGLVMLVVSLVDNGSGLCCGPMVLCVVGLVLCFTVFNGFLIHGRWVPADGEGVWVELLSGGVLKMEDGTVGTYVLSRNKRFIDIRVAGRLVDSWKILSWGTSTLEVQDVTGKAHSFTKGKTLEEKKANPFHRDRTDHLPGTWEPIDGSNKWVQFTTDGAIVFAGGAAGKYAVSGEEPNEVIQAKMADGSARKFRVMSLSRNQLVLSEGSEATTYTRLESEKSGVGAMLSSLFGGGTSGGSRGRSKKARHKPSDREYQELLLMLTGASFPEEKVAELRGIVNQAEMTQEQRRTVENLLQAAIRNFKNGQPEGPGCKPEDVGMGGEPEAFDTVCPHCLTQYAVRCQVGAVLRCQDCLRDFEAYRRVASHYARKSTAGKLVNLFNPFAGLNPLAKEKCPECGDVAVKVGVHDPGPQWVGNQLVPSITVFHKCDSCRVIWGK